MSTNKSLLSIINVMIESFVLGTKIPTDKILSDLKSTCTQICCLLFLKIHTFHRNFVFFNYNNYWYRFYFPDGPV